MHPFRGSSRCPRCEKAVYAAEQVMGPGRKLYHKPCLACTSCNKRLDSLTLLEHDQQPYCKSCHVKNFGTRDLRQANLPHREATPPPSRPTSPERITSDLTSSPSSEQHESLPPVVETEPAPATTLAKLIPTHVLTSRTNIPPPEPVKEENDWANDTESEERDTVDLEPLPRSSLESSRRFPVTPSRPAPLSPSYTGSSTASAIHSSSPTGSFRRPISPTRTGSGHALSRSVPHFGIAGGGVSLGRSNSTVTAMEMLGRPIMQTATGTRYGAALVSPDSPNISQNSPGSPTRRWGPSNAVPICPRCNKSVYFAEQVKAVGKTFHRSCLRCVECGTSLDSNRLTEKDGSPMCHRCYGKMHGPQGGGYALLGKAGG